MSTPKTPPRRDIIAELRAAIAKAAEAGAAHDDLLLQVTHRDASTIKLSPDVALDEVSFVGGQMRFLGVKVEVGAVTVSALSGG